MATESFFNKQRYQFCSALFYDISIFYQLLALVIKLIIRTKINRNSDLISILYIYNISAQAMSSQDKFIDLNYVFSLRALNKDCYYQRIQADFTPIIKVAKNQIHFITPKFHDDGRYFTAGFVLPHQQEILDIEEPRHRRNFHAKIKKYEEVKTPQVCLMQDPKLTYCHVCKKSITNYFDHVNEKSHLRSIHQTGAKQFDANQYISELVKKVQTQHVVADDQCSSQKSVQTKATKKPSKTKQVAKRNAKSTNQNQKSVNKIIKQKSKKIDKEQRQMRVRKASVCQTKVLRSTNAASNKESRLNCIRI